MVIFSHTKVMTVMIMMLINDQVLFSVAHCLSPALLVTILYLFIAIFSHTKVMTMMMTINDDLRPRKP